MIDPLLDRPLHLDLGHPVDVVGRGLVVGRRLDPSVQLGVGDRRQLRGVVSAGFQPFDEIMMVNVVLLELLARFVLEVHMRVVVRGVDLAAALIDRAEDRLDARRGLRHERRRTRRSDRQHGDIAASHPAHLLVERRIGLADAGDHRVVELARGVVEREGPAFFGHLDRCAVGSQGQGFVHLDGECDRFVRTVAHPQRGDHVAFGGDAQAGAAAFECHFAHFFPEVALHVADIGLFGVGVDLGDDLLDLFQFQVDDVVHHAHGLAHVVAEF